MIPAFYETPQDKRQPHCWIDKDHVIRLTPIYTEKGDDGWEYVCLPDNPGARVLFYKVLYCDNCNYECEADVIEKAFHLSSEEVRVDGFNTPPKYKKSKRKSKLVKSKPGRS